MLYTDVGAGEEDGGGERLRETVMESQAEKGGGRQWLAELVSAAEGDRAHRDNAHLEFEREGGLFSLSQSTEQEGCWVWGTRSPPRPGPWMGGGETAGHSGGGGGPGGRNPRSASNQAEGKRETPSCELPLSEGCPWENPGDAEQRGSSVRAQGGEAAVQAEQRTQNTAGAGGACAARPR